MLNVTSAARTRLLSKMELKEAAEDESFRFLRKDNGWALCLDREDSDDTAFTCQGRHVLLLDATVAKAMGSMTLDAQKTDQGMRLKLHRNKREGK